MSPHVFAWPGLGFRVPALDVAGVLSPPPSSVTGPATSRRRALPFFFFFIVSSQFVLISNYEQWEFFFNLFFNPLNLTYLYGHTPPSL